MIIKRATQNDIDGINKLLKQVLTIHHNQRPDLFKSGAKKYTDEELSEIIKSNSTPVFCAVDEKDNVLGYAFCIINQYFDNNILTDIKTLYIDDLCVDENIRGNHIGKKLYDYVLDYAKSINCYNVTLNVWAKNESAMKFYERCGMVPQKIGMETIL